MNLSFKNKIKIPKEIQYIIFLFLTSRVILTTLGLISRAVLDPLHPRKPGWVFSKHLWLNVWGVWDTGWYLSLAKNWYSPILSQGQETLNQANYAFFPLYPFLIKCLGTIIGNNFLAGLIISNVFLIIACVFLFRLAKLEFGSDELALKSVKYLFLFPVAFVFSGVFNESLFLALLIFCFYFAKKGNWFLAGISGLFLSLTRFIGVFVVLPLLFEYFKERKLKQVKLDIFFLILIPLGLLSFSVYNHYLTGDFLAFAKIQDSWGRYFTNPFLVLFDNLRAPNIYALFAAYFTLVFLVFLIVFYKKMKFSYWLLGIYSIFIPLLTGLESMPRYILIIFPFYILFAKLAKDRPNFDEILTVFLALLQGGLMILWTNGFPLII